MKTITKTVWVVCEDDGTPIEGFDSPIDAAAFATTETAPFATTEAAPKPTPKPKKKKAKAKKKD